MSPAYERTEELAALCAAGAATASEQAELDSMAARDPHARALLHGYADAASLLALDLVRLAPPMGGLDAIRRRLPTAGAGGAGGAGGLGGAGMPLPGRLQGAGGDVVPIASRRRAPVVAAAVIVPLAAAAAFAFLWSEERSRGAELLQQVAGLETEVGEERRVRTRAVEETGRLERRLAELEGTLQKVSTPELKLATVKNDQGVVIKILIDPLTGNWYVMAFQLPPVGDKDYQLWFLDKNQGGKPIPSELLRPGPAQSLQAITQVPRGIDPMGAAVSLEPKGGSPDGNPTQVMVGGVL